MSKSLPSKNQSLVVGTRFIASAPIIVALLLILIVASRAYRIDVDVLDVQTDEAWSVFQTFGTVTDIVRWTPYDWTPLYYVGLGAWREVVGAHPVVLRWLSVLLFAVGCSLMYRVGRRLFREGVLPMLAFAGFAYMVFLSTEMRGYAFMLALYPLALWLTLRYFHAPTLRRALPLGIVLAALFYISLTAAPAIGMLVLFTVILYGARAWRWIVPGVIAMVIAAPEIINKASVAVGRAQATATIQLPPFGEALISMYRAHTGYPFILWIALVLLAAIISLTPPPARIWGREQASRFVFAPSPEFGGRLGWGFNRLFAALFVWLLMPIFLYFSNAWLGFFNQRYAWWVMVGVALLVGMGLSRLNRPLRFAAAALLLVFTFLPIPLPDYQLHNPPLASSFAWLAERLSPADVVLVDPNCNCASTEQLAYLTRAYFPQGLRYVTEPGNYRRVWYVTGAAGATPGIGEQVERGRMLGGFVGPPEALFRLYEAPPDPVGEVYENGMRFHGGEIVGTNGLNAFHEGESLTLRLWWSADRPPTQDYSVAILVQGAAGNVVLQQDSAPQTTPPETSRWQPGTLYAEDRTLTLPFPLLRDTYQVKLALYWYGDQVRLTAPSVDANGLRHVIDLSVASW